MRITTFVLLLALTATPASALTYTCYEVGNIAVKVYDAKQAGNSLRAILAAIAQTSAGDEAKATLLTGIAMAVYGDNSLTRSKAYDVAYESCMNH